MWCICFVSVALSSFQEREYAFEMASSNIRYGDGVTKEVGMDVVNLGIRNLVVITDKNVRKQRCKVIWFVCT